MPACSRGALVLALLSLAAAGCGAVETQADGSGRSLERYGIGFTLPVDWHARLTRGTVEAATGPLGPAGQDVTLGPGDVALKLFEFEPDSSRIGQFEEASHPVGRPQPFTVDEFEPPEFPGDEPRNHGFARRNFSLAGRLFDLFIEAGRRNPCGEAVAAVNELVASLAVLGGDFYPGTIEPPRFEQTAGWHVGAAGGGEVRATDVAEAWAATVPYRNGALDLPPADTLETLPADGILIWVGLSRDNRFPPTAELRDPERIDLPLRFAQTRGGVGWEGQIRQISLYRLFGRFGEQYDLDLWIFFGAGEPAPDQRARAQTMLDRLELPRWGTWELDGRGDVGAN